MPEHIIPVIIPDTMTEPERMNLSRCLARAAVDGGVKIVAFQTPAKTADRLRRGLWRQWMKPKPLPPASQQ